MNPRLADFLARDPDAAALEKFLQENTVPLTDAEGVTFLYRGSAEAVFLQHWVYGLPSSQALEHAPDIDL